MKVLSLAASLLVFTSTVFIAAPTRGQSADTSGDRKVVRKISPTYPAIARTLALSGSVKLEVIVMSSGAVKSVQVLGGSPVLAEAAQAAVRDWRWEKSDHESTEHVEVRFNP
jgi:TonB family protein